MMKTLPAAVIVAVALACLPVSLTAATLTVSPNVISDDYSGVLTFQIGGLNAGETVLVEQLSDFDGDGVPETHDLTLAAFPLVDGQASVIGGVTNLHVPGDLSPAAGSITAQLHMAAVSFQRKAVGKHVFRVSSPTTRFPAVVTPFAVTNTPYGSEVSGQIRSSGAKVPFALVVLFRASGDSMKPALAGASDANGNYRLSAPPGGYIVSAFKSKYVADFAEPTVVALMPGENISTNVIILSTSRTISGRLFDSTDSPHGLGGVLMVAESPVGQIAAVFTDLNGNYSLGVTPGLWEVGPENADLNGLGYVGNDSWPQADCTGGNAAVSIAVPKGSALIYGTVWTDTGTPLPGMSLWGGDWPDESTTNPLTDESGRYFGLVSAGTWQIGLRSEENAASANYVFSSQAQNINVASGNAVLRDFKAKAAPYLITGSVKDTAMGPVDGLTVWGTSSSDGLEYTAQAVTDESGFFAMHVFNGQWSLTGACEGEEGLRVRGFSCMNGTLVTVANANGTVNLTATRCTGLQISTSSLINGTVGQSYAYALQAQSCEGTLNWSMALGSGPLPPGLYLMSNGQIAGMPSQVGNFGFTVQVNDGSGSATKPLMLSIEDLRPLAIFSGDPVHGTNGIPYIFTLQGQGGLAPHTWTLAPGSGPLPGGLTFTTSGDIIGTPNLPGEFFFRVRLTDAAQAYVEQLLRLVVTAAVVPVDITTTSLAGGTVGVPYSATLEASGGQTPYYWQMALGSAPLPQGLSLAQSSGQIQGIPVVSGTFQFIVHVQDSAISTGSVEQVLSLTIQQASRPSIGTPRIGTDGKFQFQIIGVGGVTYTIDTSDDLQTWSPLRSTNAPSDAFIFVADWPVGARGYFRVRTGH